MQVVCVCLPRVTSAGRPHKLSMHKEIAADIPKVYRGSRDIKMQSSNLVHRSLTRNTRPLADGCLSINEEDVAESFIAEKEELRGTEEEAEKNDQEETADGIIPSWAWRQWQSVSFDALPNWLKDNEYLLHGHRPPLPSVRACLKSMFRLHTETWNIWTHLLGMLLFVVVALCVYVFEMSEVISSVPWYEQLIIGTYFLGAVSCLSLSFLYHTLSCHSARLSHLFCKLDYMGIAILVTGSCIPCLYYGYYCSAFSRYLHISIVSMLCIGIVIASIWHKLSTPKYRPVRTLMFVLFGLYGVIPAIQVAYREGLSTAATSYSGWWLISMAVIYIGGAGLYVARIPERFNPGKFDICMHSHQLFHVCVVAAAWVHYDGILNMISYRLSVGVECAIA